MIPSIVVAAALRIVTVRGTHVLQVTPAIASAISAYAATFEPWRESDYDGMLRRTYKFSDREAPFAVIADFNGDGTPDVAIDGHTKTKAVVIAVVSTPGGYRVIEVAHGPGGVPKIDYVDLVRAPHHFIGAFEGHPLDLRHDAFEVVWYEKASTLFYWRRGRFVRYITGD